jgi:hypothetical protein
MIFIIPTITNNNNRLPLIIYLLCSIINFSPITSISVLPIISSFCSSNLFPFSPIIHIIPRIIHIHPFILSSFSFSSIIITTNKNNIAIAPPYTIIIIHPIHSDSLIIAHIPISTNKIINHITAFIVLSLVIITILVIIIIYFHVISYIPPRPFSYSTLFLELELNQYFKIMNLRCYLYTIHFLYSFISLPY